MANPIGEEYILVRSAARGRWGGLAVWFLGITTLVLLCAASAVANVQPLEVKSYSDEFNVSEAVAEERLDVQSKGTEADIVGELEQRLDENYAGVWFDNASGEYVVPIASGADDAAVGKEMDAARLAGEYRTRVVQHSWEELETAHERIDKALLPLIEESLVQTALDPRANAVVVYEADGANATQRTRIQARAAAEGVDVEVREKSEDVFDVSTMACQTTSPRSCGRPLRGGVAITPFCTAPCSYTYGECTAGFKGIGDITGDRYILTAGHCAFKSPGLWRSADASSFQSLHDIGSVEQYTFPGNDWAKIKATGSSYWDWTPWPSEVAHYWEDQERAITSESSNYMGQYVCHSGNKTGTSCGNVSLMDHTVNDSLFGVVIYHETEFGDVCSIGGDSGGPVFSGNTALGLYSASTAESEKGACDATAYYVEITEATDAMGVHVAPRIAPPIATTGTATQVDEEQITANGTVDANGLLTTYYFQYGTTTGYGNSTESASAGSGSQPIGVSRTISGLQPDTTYHYRLVATNGYGTSYGADQTVRTLTSQSSSRWAIRDPATGAQWVYYRGSGGQLCSAGFVNGSGWSYACLGGQALAANSSPTAIRDPATGAQWVYYTGSNNQLCSAGFVNGSGWSYACLGGQAPATGASPTAIRDPATGAQWVYYRGSNAQLCGQSFVNGSGWSSSCLGGEAAASGANPTAIRDRASGGQWLYYKGTNNQLCAAGFVNGSGWNYACLGGQAAG